MRYALAAASLAVAALAVTSVLAAGGKPKTADVTASWQLDFTVLDKAPQLIKIKVPGKGTQSFWFMRYELVNNTGDDQMFVPDFVLYSGDGQVIQAGDGVPPQVFRTIKTQFGDPLLLDNIDMNGTIRQGDDNVKRGVAIFKDFPRTSDTVDIFVGGLSGESQTVKLPEPVKVAAVRDGKVVTETRNTETLYRTKQMTFEVPADATAMTLDKETWVMR